MVRFAHTNLICRDWRRVADFYIAVFGCRLVPPERSQSGAWLSQGTGLPHAQLEGAHLALPGYEEGGPTLEVYQYRRLIPQDPPAPNRQGFGHVAFEVDDVAGMMAAVVAHGGSLQGALTTRAVDGVGQLSFVYVRDPEGNLVELQRWAR